ncbi:hypothetical protein AJ80_06697 [Polytolypa hystricis UAMH7299]|uniref:Hypervirulence associated protein TUDOR domain-containing protein n=1 Tax=Polytolypa hystricis (strain UAMH7299) TaxID=1447883 RepID=A0A2B7XTL5_POLH7|nr:hypothetical protein AJ80_06697 [Polytolypa hystricis UAMH7299]
MPNFQVGQAVRYKQGEGPEPKTPESTGTIKIVVQEPGESGTGENEEPVYQVGRTPSTFYGR